MKESDFVYWLQGFVELSDTGTISEKQWLVIKDHLKLVFDKVTPDRPKPIELVNKQFEWMHERGPVKLSDLMTKQYGFPPAIC